MTQAKAIEQAPSGLKITFEAVDSSSIDQIGYDAASSTLAIIFQSNPNAAYLYQNVTLAMWVDFKSADSYGRWYSEFLRSNYYYPCTKVLANAVTAISNPATTAATVTITPVAEQSLQQAAPHLTKFLSAALAEAIEALQQAKNTNNTKLAETATDMVMSLTNLLQDAVQA